MTPLPDLPQPTPSRRRLILQAVAGAAVATLVVGGAIALVTSSTKSTEAADTVAVIRSTQKEQVRARQSQDRSLALLEESVSILQDCTVADEENTCYQRGVKNTAAAVVAISNRNQKAAAAAAACADKPAQQTYRQIYQCVLLTTADPPAPPQP